MTFFCVLTSGSYNDLAEHITSRCSVKRLTQVVTPSSLQVKKVGPVLIGKAEVFQAVGTLHVGSKRWKIIRHTG